MPPGNVMSMRAGTHPNIEVLKRTSGHDTGLPGERQNEEIVQTLSTS